MAERHMSLDLETVGTRPGSVILSVGVAIFEPVTGVVCTHFQENLETEPQTEAGLTSDVSTIEWWGRQPAEVWNRSRINRKRPAEALTRIAGFYKAFDCSAVWGHGAGFDVTLLECAMRAFQVSPPWKFWDVRDTRTLFAASGVRVDRDSGTHHVAADDARNQALAVVKSYRALGLSGGLVRRKLGSLLRWQP